jgi:hypothetical protein
MTKLFYDHLIIIEDILVVLDTKQLSQPDKEKILSLIDEDLHHQIIDIILTYLPKDHHPEFLQKLIHHPYDPEIMKFLIEKSPVDIEKKIIITANKAKKKIMKHLNGYL